MLAIHEQIRSHFVVTPSELPDSFIKEFAAAVRGEIVYDSSFLPIEIWEDFLLNWLNGSAYEGKEDYMKLLYHTFREEYPFEGILYRGIIKSKDEELYPMDLASYSSSDEVAFYFKGDSEAFGKCEIRDDEEQMVLELDAEGAFAFDEFLKRVLSLTDNQELKDEINERIWEEEKIYPMPLYVLDGL